MSFRLHLVRLPSRVGAPRPLVLTVVHAGQRTCLRAVMEMCPDLHQHGTASRDIKPPRTRCSTPSPSPKCRPAARPGHPKEVTHPHP